MMLVETWWTPLASNAEASVSPRYPIISFPSKVKRSEVSRSIRPPVGVRSGRGVVVGS